MEMCRLQRAVSGRVPREVGFGRLRSVRFLFPYPFAFVFYFGYVGLVSCSAFRYPCEHGLFGVSVVRSTRGNGDVFTNDVGSIVYERLSVPFFEWILDREGVCLSGAPRLGVLAVSLAAPAMVCYHRVIIVRFRGVVRLGCGREVIRILCVSSMVGLMGLQSGAAYRCKVVTFPGRSKRGEDRCLWIERAISEVFLFRRDGDLHVVVVYV